jgi:hypothetical protein
MVMEGHGTSFEAWKEGVSTHFMGHDLLKGAHV